MAFLQQKPVLCLGFDIAKATITVAGGTTTHVIANKRQPIRRLLRAQRPDLVVCEPTGGHELLLIEEAMAAGIACHRADTNKLKSFMRSFTIAKTDAIDAALIAAYGRERWAALPLWQAPDSATRRLRDLVRRRRDLIAMRTAEKNRAKAPGNRALASSFKAVIATLQHQIEAVDAAISTLIANTQALSHRTRVLTAMQGIGPISAAALIAILPELGSMTRRQAASLAALAPHPNDSGRKTGYRKTHPGRPEVKTILFMPALRAAAGKGEFAAFYKRLIANGKKPLAAITAVMRKIIITLNARLRDNSTLPQS